MKSDNIKYDGFYRAKVINNKDPNKTGRILVWIPDLMPELDPEKDGIWALSANNPIGGRNMDSKETDNHFSGSCYIPNKGSYVFVFFEKGNPNNPFYFGSVDLTSSPVLAENQTGDNYEKKWTLFKSPDGRAVTISDDPSDSRLELTGRKKQLQNAPSGDTNSVFNIDGNQTSILIDERDGKEKILIRTYKGDFFSIDCETQELKAYFKGNIYLKSMKSIFLSAEEDINIVSHKNTNIKSDEKLGIVSGNDIDIKSGNQIKIQGNPNILLNSGSSPEQIPDTEYNGNRII